MEKNYNRLDVRATPSGRGPFYGSYVQERCNRQTLGQHRQETCGARYGKLVAQKTVWKVNASVRMLPREIRDRLDLGLLSL